MEILIAIYMVIAGNMIDLQTKCELKHSQKICIEKTLEYDQARNQQNQ